MKNKFIYIIISFLLIPKIIFAFGEFNLGGELNPLNIKITQDPKEQKRQENLNKESQLKSAYGYSNYVSCKSRACGSYDATDPYAVSGCLNMVEAWFGYGRCNNQTEQIKKIISCNDGYTNVDGVCKSYNSICSGKWANSKWNGELNDNGGAVCDCQSGYVWNNQNTECVIKTNISTPIKNTIEPKLENKVNTKTTSSSSTDFDIKDEDIESFVTKGVLMLPTALRKCPSNNCSIIRYYAEASKVSIIGKYKKDNWYQIEGTTDAGGGGVKTKGWINTSVFSEILPVENVKLDSNNLNNIVIDNNIITEVKKDSFWTKIKRLFRF